MHRVKVRVVEDALDANNTIARANRDDFDRHGVAVVNLMSAPGAGKTSLLERALELPRTLVLGCEPLAAEEFTELSEPVRAALPAAEELLRGLLDDLLTGKDTA